MCKASLSSYSSSSQVSFATATASGSAQVQALSAAVGALLSVESQSSPSGGAVDDVALALESRAAHVHEVICVLALALDHERSPGVSLGGAPKSAATMLVRTLRAGDAPRSFLLSFGGGGSEAHLRRLDPHGWYSDSKGAVGQSATLALCALLWPTAPAPQRGQPSSGSAWHTMLPGAQRSLALSMAGQLAAHAHAKSGSASFAESAAILLSTLRALLITHSVGGGVPAATWRVPTPPSLLSAEDESHLLSLVASALVALPAKQAPMAQPPDAHTSLLGCALQLLMHRSRHARADPMPVEALYPLAQQISLSLPAERGQETLPSSISVLSFILPAMPAASVDGMATQLMVAVVHAQPPNCYPLLPALLRVVGAPRLAAELLGSGLVCATRATHASRAPLLAAQRPSTRSPTSGSCTLSRAPPHVAPPPSSLACPRS